MARLFQMNSATPLEGTSGIRGENDSWNSCPSKTLWKVLLDLKSFLIGSVSFKNAGGGGQNSFGIAQSLL